MSPRLGLRNEGNEIEHPRSMVLQRENGGKTSTIAVEPTGAPQPIATSGGSDSSSKEFTNDKPHEMEKTDHRDRKAKLISSKVFRRSVSARSLRTPCRKSKSKRKLFASTPTHAERGDEMLSHRLNQNASNEKEEKLMKERSSSMTEQCNQITKGPECGRGSNGPTRDPERANEPSDCSRARSKPGTRAREREQHRGGPTLRKSYSSGSFQGPDPNVPTCTERVGTNKLTGEKSSHVMPKSLQRGQSSRSFQQTFKSMSNSTKNVLGKSLHGDQATATTSQNKPCREGSGKEESVTSSMRKLFASTPTQAERGGATLSQKLDKNASKDKEGKEQMAKDRSSPISEQPNLNPCGRSSNGVTSASAKLTSSREKDAYTGASTLRNNSDSSGSFLGTTPKSPMSADNCGSGVTEGKPTHGIPRSYQRGPSSRSLQQTFKSMSNSTRNMLGKSLHGDQVTATTSQNKPFREGLGKEESITSSMRKLFASTTTQAERGGATLSQKLDQNASKDKEGKEQMAKDRSSPITEQPNLHPCGRSSNGVTSASAKLTSSREKDAYTGTSTLRNNSGSCGSFLGTAPKSPMSADNCGSEVTEAKPTHGVPRSYQRGPSSRSLQQTFKSMSNSTRNMLGKSLHGDQATATTSQVKHSRDGSDEEECLPRSLQQGKSSEEASERSDVADSLSANHNDVHPPTKVSRSRKVPPTRSITRASRSLGAEDLSKLLDDIAPLQTRSKSCENLMLGLEDEFTADEGDIESLKTQGSSSSRRGFHSRGRRAMKAFKKMSKSTRKMLGKPSVLSDKGAEKCTVDELEGTSLHSKTSDRDGNDNKVDLRQSDTKSLLGRSLELWGSTHEGRDATQRGTPMKTPTTRRRPLDLDNQEDSKHTRSGIVKTAARLFSSKQSVNSDDSISDMSAFSLFSAHSADEKYCALDCSASSFAHDSVQSSSFGKHEEESVTESTENQSTHDPVPAQFQLDALSVTPSCLSSSDDDLTMDELDDNESIASLLEGLSNQSVSSWSEEDSDAEARNHNSAPSLLEMNFQDEESMNDDGPSYLFEGIVETASTATTLGVAGKVDSVERQLPSPKLQDEKPFSSAKFYSSPQTKAISYGHEGERGESKRDEGKQDEGKQDEGKRDEGKRGERKRREGRRPSQRRTKSSTVLRGFPNKSHRSKASRSKPGHLDAANEVKAKPIERRESKSKRSRSSRKDSQPETKDVKQKMGSRPQRTSSIRRRSSSKRREGSESESDSQSQDSDGSSSARRRSSRSRKPKDLDDSLHRSTHPQTPRKKPGYDLPFDYKVRNREAVKRSKSEGLQALRRPSTASTSSSTRSDKRDGTGSQLSSTEKAAQPIASAAHNGLAAQTA